MGIDKKTKPNFVWIQLDDKPEYLKSLRKTAEEEVQEADGKKHLVVLSDTHNFEPGEYYFDEGDNTINISGEMKSTNGNCYISLNMPLSDTIFLDIIQHAIKKMNKIKTMIESLK